VLKLDKVDNEIISNLQKDGRMKVAEIAKKVGFSSMGVHKRIKKLIEKKAIKITADLNPFYFKLLPAIVMLEMESAEAMNNLLNRFKDCPRVVKIFKTVGGYNLVALVIAENRDTLDSISVEKCSLRSNTGVRRSEFYPISDVLFSPFIPVRENLTHKNKERTPCDVDCLSCPRYIEKKCVACPATCHYRGSL
jgi:DNA-binding Lrp family transcriptional regulator